MLVARRNAAFLHPKQFTRAQELIFPPETGGKIFLHPQEQEEWMVLEHCSIFMELHKCKQGWWRELKLGGIRLVSLLDAKRFALG